MRCSNCDGELILRDGVWVCSSCGTKMALTEYQNDCEVYICYLESDESGRRTKDSAVAQEIYHILDGKKIKTFYNRISLESYSGDSAKTVDEVSFLNAKIILLVASSKENYSTLWSRYEGKIGNKKIIPVYFGMNANDMPGFLSSIQALKYDSVGASADLGRIVLKALGRHEEIENDYNSLSKKQTRNRTKMIVIGIFVLAFVIVAGVIIVINSRKEKEPDRIEKNEGVVVSSRESKEIEITEGEEESFYIKAVHNMDQNKYADAIDIFSALGDYKDSASLLHTCYMKYAGYYVDEDLALYFRLQIFEKNNGSIEIYRIDENGEKCSLTENFSLAGCSGSIFFKDSENNTGDASIELENGFIRLTLVSSEVKSDIQIPDCDIKFDIKEKSDQPMEKRKSDGFYAQVLDGKTSIGDIQRQGYDVSYYKDYITENEEFGDLECGGKIYTLDNTDLSFIAFNFDVSEYSYYDKDYETYDDPIIRIIQGPASEILPKRIGDELQAITEDGCLFLPNTKLYYFSDLGFISFSDEGDTITESTWVNVITTESVGEEKYNRLLSEYENYGKNHTESENIKQVEVPFIVRAQDVAINTGPGEDYPKTGNTTGVGAFTIVEVQDGWGKLKSGAGWINLDEVTIVESNNGRSSNDRKEKIYGVFQQYTFAEINGGVLEISVWDDGGQPRYMAHYYDPMDPSVFIEEHYGNLIYSSEDTEKLSYLGVDIVGDTTFLFEFQFNGGECGVLNMSSGYQDTIFKDVMAYRKME